MKGAEAEMPPPLPLKSIDRKAEPGCTFFKDMVKKKV
jgi:hypothetical protein